MDIGDECPESLDQFLYFTQFWEYFGQIIVGWRTNPLALGLAPPLGNPGSATDE